jgi:gamma-glutamylcyclotransferase (GGCT)/AIG2-like uncharacterized protein YtfP
MNLFTYGTLMDSAVWQRVVQRDFPCVPAVLSGYEARRLRGFAFPGLVEAPESVTQGLLYRGLDAAAMQRLDDYEDDFYERIAVTVQTAAGDETAEVYLMAPQHRSHVLPEIWHPPQRRGGV